MYEFFIAKRYSKTKHKLNFITIISILSTIGICIGVAALIIILSVFNGFGAIVKNIFLSFDPHIKVIMVSDSALIDRENIYQQIVDQKGISQISTFVDGKAILLSDNSYEILRINGLTHEENKIDKLSQKIISGEFNLKEQNGLPSIVLGKQMALKLNRLVGDTVLITSFEQLENTLLSYSIPTTYKFFVSGIFSANNSEYDNSYAFTSLFSAQKLLGYDNRISGYNLQLDSFENADEIKASLNNKINLDDVKIYTWYDLHKDLYDVMQIERWAAFLILMLIVAIAAFNIMASLAMTVVEKKKDIGILRTMGASQKSIQKIYLLQGSIIGIFGTLMGLIIGLSVCYAQIEFNFYPLDPMKFIIDALPLEIRISDVLVVTLTSLLLSVGVGFLPARNAVKIKITDAIKWE